MSMKPDVLECDFLKYPIQTQGEFKYEERSDYNTHSSRHGVSCNHDNETSSHKTHSHPSASDQSETSDQSIGSLDLSREISDSINSNRTVVSEQWCQSSSVVSEHIGSVVFSAEGSAQLPPRKQLTAEEKREKHRLDQQQRRINELPWEKTRRLQRSAERQRLKRLNLTETEKLRAKELAKKRTKERRARETEQEKEIRRIRDRMRMREKRALIKQVRVLGAEVVAQTCVRLLNPPSGSQLLVTPSSSSTGTVDLSNIVLTSDTLLPNSPSVCSEVSCNHDNPSEVSTQTPSESSDQNCSTQVTSGDSQSLHSSEDQQANSSNCDSDSTNSSHILPSSTSALYAVAKDYLAAEHEKYLKQKERQRLRCKERRARELPEERAVRLRKAADRQRLKRMSLTEQEKVLYNEVNRVRAKKRRSEESPQQQENRRTSERVRRREQRALVRQVQEIGSGPPTFVTGLNHSEGGSELLGGDFVNRGFADSEFILF